MYGVQLPQGYTDPLWGGSLLFTRNYWYSLNLSQKNEKLRWPWSHPVVLNLSINLVITKYELKSQYIKVTQLWPCELFQSDFSVLSGRLIKNMFPLHICRPNDYTIEIIVLLQIQIYNILLMFFPLFCNVFTNILKIYELPKIYNKLLVAKDSFDTKLKNS